MNLRRLIYLFSTVWLLVILLIVNISIYFLFYKITTNSELNRMAGQAENISEAVKPGSNIDPADLLGAYLPADGMIRVINQDSQVILATTKNTKMTNRASTFQNSQTASLQNVNGNTYGVVSIPVIWEHGQVVSLEITENLQDIEKDLNVLKVVLIAAFFVVMIPSILGGRLLSNVLLSPINSMINTMKDIQQSGTFKKIHLRKKQQDELNKMAETFNHTMDILETTFEKQQAFVSDASHELKTPLTVIESYAKMLKRWGKKKPEVLEESIEAIYSEAIRMKGMADQMLQLAENDEDWNLNPTTMNLVDLCENTGRMFENAYQREVHIQANDEQVLTKADEAKMKQVLFIFLDNALKYSSETIDIEVGREDEYVFFAVRDHGIGIPENEVEHVFDRFFRVDKARSRKNGGTGLGLAIAKRIIHAHQGFVRLESTEGEGTKVTVLFPGR